MDDYDRKHISATNRTPTSIAEIDPWVLEQRLLPIARFLYGIGQRLLPRGSVIRLILSAILKRAGRSAKPDTSPIVQEFDPPSRTSGSVRRIAILALDHIGDFVMALPAIRLLREQFPHASITLICGQWSAPLARMTGLVDVVEIFDAFPAASGDTDHAALDHIHLPWRIRQLETFDIAVDLGSHIKVRKLVTELRSHFRAGFHAPGMGPALDLMMPRCFRDDWTDIDSSLSARGVGVGLASAIVSAFKSDEWVLQSIGDTQSTITPWPKGHPVVGINTGSGTETRRWPLEMYCDLAARFIGETDIHVVLFGSKADATDAAMFETGIAGDRITNLIGKIDLPDFACMVAKVDLFIGNDTGSTHIASGTGVRTICLFAGPGPLGRNVLRHANSTTLYVKLSCNMCSHVRVSDCPNDFLCAKAIGVDRVFDLALAKLDRWRARQVDTLR